MQMCFLCSSPSYDARMINETNSETGETITHSELIVPLAQFGDFVGDFQYNVNVSGFRLSIPARFIDSFMVGTGVITDKLNAKWYKPFGPEVIETVRMSYMLNKDVDWDQFCMI